MPENLEQKLIKIEKGTQQLLHFFARMTQPGEEILISDFIIIAALKRTMALANGFIGHIRNRNFTCAGALLRMQLDTAMRLYGATLHSSSAEYAQKIFEGARVDRLKDRNGQRMTDSYLAEKLSEQYPWAKAVYEHLCDFVHFSNRHFFASISELEEDARGVKFMISAEDPPRPDEAYFEIVDAYNETIRVTSILAAGWHAAIHPRKAA
jgi:hypothetical protein